MQTINDFQRKNLEKLATFLEEKYSNSDSTCFNMVTFGEMFPCMNLCGTVTCAVGHGPMAGIEAKPDEGWDSYIHRNFANADFAYRDIIFKYLFSQDWRYYDNTPLGAAARIRYFLEHEDTIEEYYDNFNPSETYRKEN